jgi:hypothetical protein
VSANYSVLVYQGLIRGVSLTLSAYMTGLVRHRNNKTRAGYSNLGW